MLREDWLRRLREQLPFASNRVSSPVDAEVNVASIQRVAYEQLMAAADEARLKPRGGLGVLLWGDPGVGKSHLLTRFAAEIERDERGLFLLNHNLLASPRLLPSTVVRWLVARLAAAPPGKPATAVLYKLLYHQVRQAVPSPQGRPPNSIGKEQARKLFLQRVAETVEPYLPDQNRPDVARIAAVLFSYFLAVHKLKETTTTADWRTHYERVATIAKQYLMGDELDAEAWQWLETEPATIAAPDPWGPNDQFLETVSLILLEIARQAGMLVVLCFDQVENLSDDRFVELFRFNHALLDHGRNLLVITAGVRSDLLALRTRGLAPEAAWDRLAGDTIDLYFISLAAARELLEARLKPALATDTSPPDVEEARSRDPLFPLGEPWWAARVAGLIEARPRDVISWAHQRWREQCRALAADWNGTLRQFGSEAPLARVPSPASSDHVAFGGTANTPTDGPTSTQATRDLSTGPCAEATEEFTQLVDERVEQRVGTKREAYRSEPSRLPADSGQLTGLLRATLSRIGSSPLLVNSWWSSFEPMAALPSDLVLACEEPVSVAGRRPTYDLLVRWKSATAGADLVDRFVETGVVVVVTVSANSTAATYRRLSEDPRPPGRLVVLMDERIPEALGHAGQRYRDALEARKEGELHFINLSFDEFGELSALEAVLADARSGDLEVERPSGGLVRLGERDVEASYARRQRYLALPLLRRLLGPAAHENGRLG